MLNIKIRSANFDITPTIEDYVFKKVGTLEKLFDTDSGILCEVELGKTTEHHKSGDIFRAELNIVEPKNKQSYVVAEESDLYAAIDVMRDNAEEVIVSNKKKKNTLVRRGASKVKSMLKHLHFRS